MAKNVRFEVTADVADVLKKLGLLGGSFKELAATAEQQTQKIGSSFGQIFSGTFMSGIAQKALGGVSMAIGSLGRSMIQGNAQMESYATSFEVLLGGVGNAQKMLGDLKKFGAETPFELNGLAQSTQVMLSFGIGADQVMDNLRMLGDVSMGNAEKLSSLTLAFSQVQSAGKLTGQDLMQMINAGFNPLQTMSQKTGKSIGQLKEEMEKGAISADMVRQSLVDATGAGGQFEGMMAKQAGTFQGLMSTMQDTVGEIARTIGAPLFEAAKAGLGKLLEVLTKPEIQNAFTALGEGLGNVLGPALELIAPLFEFLIPVITDVAEAVSGLLPAISEIVKVLLGALKPVLPIIGQLLAALSPVIIRLAEVIARVVRALQPLIDVALRMLSERIDILMPLLDSLVSILEACVPIIELWAKALTFAVQVGEGMINAVLRPIVAVLKEIISYATAAANAITGLFGAEQKRAAVKKPEVKKEEAPAPETTLPASPTPKPAAPSKKGSSEAKKKRDEAYKEAEADLAREEELTLLRAKQQRKTEEEIFAIAQSFQTRKLALARKYLQEKGTIADIETEIEKGQIERTIALEERARAVDDTNRRAESESRVAALQDAARTGEQMLEDERRRIEMQEGLRRLMSNQDPVTAIQEEAAATQALADLELRALREKLGLLTSISSEQQRQLELDREEAERVGDIVKANELRIQVERLRADTARQVAEIEREMQLKQEDAQQRQLEASRKIDEERRASFEGRYAQPVAELGGEVFKSMFDAQVTGAERARMVWEGLGDIAMNILTEMATTYIKNALMSLATTVGLIPAQAAAAATTAAAWAPAAAAVSLASFGTNSIAASAGITSTFALTKALSVIPLAEGAILNKPVFLAGEAGQEAVIPLTKLPGLVASSVREALAPPEASTIPPIRKSRPERMEGAVSVHYSSLDRASRATEFRRTRSTW